MRSKGLKPVVSILSKWCYPIYFIRVRILVGFLSNLTTLSRFVTGTIGRERFSGFERVLWRATRGNVYVRHSGIPDPIRDPSTVRHPFLSNEAIIILSVLLLREMRYTRTYSCCSSQEKT